MLLNLLIPTFPSRNQFPGDSYGKESACSAGDPHWIPGWGRSPGEVNRYPLQYSCLENSMDRGAWNTNAHGGHKVSRTTEGLTHALTNRKGEIRIAIINVLCRKSKNREKE